ncbi:hypothetical protein PIB30_076888 [Stylosanthes scabra]|uniref:Uncharacterized protein n=1 Tax=Stylosanthes scabra TaxID=79078 RepID=A0ABU6TR23_9FABA|nr:hypothetical protein [Stylosanthes scabra]
MPQGFTTSHSKHQCCMGTPSHPIAPVPWPGPTSFSRPQPMTQPTPTAAPISSMLRPYHAALTTLPPMQCRPLPLWHCLWLCVAPFSRHHSLHKNLVEVDVTMGVAMVVRKEGAEQYHNSDGKEEMMRWMLMKVKVVE